MFSSNIRLPLGQLRRATGVFAPFASVLIIFFSNDLRLSSASSYNLKLSKCPLDTAYFFLFLFMQRAKSSLQTSTLRESVNVTENRLYNSTTDRPQHRDSVATTELRSGCLYVPQVYELLKGCETGAYAGGIRFIVLIQSNHLQIDVITKTILSLSY